MEFNVCQICGAKDGRAGFLVANSVRNLVPACQNCDDTRRTGVIVIHAHLSRTEKELTKTMNILKGPVSTSVNSTINNTLILYAVRNSSGQYFRAKGYHGQGATWVNDINKAKIYGGTGGARGTITWMANAFPKYPILDLIKLTVSGIEVVDEKDRVLKTQIKKAKAEEQRKAAQAKRELENAKKKLAEAEANIKRLTNF